MAKVRARDYPDNKIALAAGKGRLERLFAQPNRPLEFLQCRLEDSSPQPPESHWIGAPRLTGQIIRTTSQELGDGRAKSKCDFWTKLLTKAIDAETDRQHRLDTARSAVRLGMFTAARAAEVYGFSLEEITTSDLDSTN